MLKFVMCMTREFYLYVALGARCYCARLYVSIEWCVNFGKDTSVKHDVLSILAIIKREFGTALRLIVASHVYHRARSNHLDRFLLFARGQDLDASFDLLKVLTHAAFTLLRSRPDVRHLVCSEWRPF